MSLHFAENAEARADGTNGRAINSDGRAGDALVIGHHGHRLHRGAREFLGLFLFEAQLGGAEAFVEVALSVKGETTIDSLTDKSGRDVIEDIDPDDPVL